MFKGFESITYFYTLCTLISILLLNNVGVNVYAKPPLNILFISSDETNSHQLSMAPLMLRFVFRFHQYEKRFVGYLRTFWTISPTFVYFRSALQLKISQNLQIQNKKFLRSKVFLECSVYSLYPFVLQFICSADYILW